ncbi:MAG: PKD domain-containing protein [Actinomycetota bacterium]|nr:PKD domain-containing protein [Actinomycetota bacterium]
MIRLSTVTIIFSWAGFSAVLGVFLALTLIVMLVSAGALRAEAEHGGNHRGESEVISEDTQTVPPDEEISSGEASETEGSPQALVSYELSNPISPDDFEPVAFYGGSYLALNSSGKKLLYLEGNAYERGYAEGQLCPQGVWMMTHDYLENVFFELVADFGLDLDLRDNPFIWNLIWSLLQVLVEANQDSIQEEFRQEMMGIADACLDQGLDVTYRDLITLNAGFDTLESIYAGFAALLCNEFAVFDGATTDGRLYHGRDFMFPTGGDVFSDQSLVMVHNPEQGYPFVATAAPGFVGIPTGMNTNGISCGMDVVFSIFTRPLIAGEGCLLLCRKVAQFAGSLQEGISMIHEADRAVPWLYLIADGQEPDAAVLETMASSILPPDENMYNYLIRLFSGLLSIIFPGLMEGGAGPEQTAAAEGELPQGTEGLRKEMKDSSSGDPGALPERGVLVRAADYLFPEWLEEWSSSYQDDVADWSLFPPQGEVYPDLVAMTNHYIIPLMAITCPALSGGNDNSIWRYDTLMGLLDESHGEIDRSRAMWLIDFLNPARCDYYGPDTTQSIKGHHVLMDDCRLEMWSLHGYYDHSWVHVDLEEILSTAPLSNLPPSAVSGADREVDMWTPVEFDARGSSDPDGRITSYIWDFRDGCQASTAQAAHAYESPGSYQVILTVVDDRGGTGSDSCEITVRESRDKPAWLIALLYFLFGWR